MVSADGEVEMYALGVNTALTCFTLFELLGKRLWVLGKLLTHQGFPISQQREVL